MKRLSPEDHLFLWMERRHQPMHAGGLLLFDLPEGAGRNYLSKTAEQMRQYPATLAPFNQRLVSAGIGQHGLVLDKTFDIDHHFKHLALPKPGRIRELLALISAQHSHLLDRQRPLWELSLIEGIHGKRFAVYAKVHHALMDGIAAMRLFNNFVSEDPTLTDMPPLWAMPNASRSKRPSPNNFDQLKQALKLGTRFTQNLTSITTIGKELNQLLLNTFDSDESHVGLSAPESIFNQKITGSRRFAAQSFSFQRVRALSKKFDCTVNDVVLAMCGGALRSYLLSQNALPKSPLIAIMPVSVRSPHAQTGGNQISMMLASLGTHIENTEQRLHHILNTVKEAKQRINRMSPVELQVYAMLSMIPSAIQSFTGKLPALRAFNVMISNVPGPRKPVYWNGAPLRGIYPASIVVDDAALNITLTSYADQIEFGLIACRRSLPSMQRILDYLEQSLLDLEKLAD